MAKAKNNRTAIGSRQAFRELTQEEYANLLPADQKRYNAKLRRHEQQEKKKKAMEAAEKQVLPRIDRIASAMKTAVAQNGEISCSGIDVTFASPCERAIYATRNQLIGYINKGDLIQLNCHAMPRLAAPCVVVKNGVFYFAQLIDEENGKYQNLDSQCTAQNETIVASYDEFIGEIVNIIKNPRAIFENKEPTEKKTEEK